jgi:hypothetical protein
VFQSIGAAKTAGVQREEAETRTGICVLNFLGNASKNFNGRLFFSVFFIVRANQKIRILAPGRRSIMLPIEVLLQKPTASN